MSALRLDQVASIPVDRLVCRAARCPLALGYSDLMAPMRILYLALAIWGSIHPMYYFITWFNENGYDIMAMVDAWHVNAASSGLVWDLTIAALALTIWIIAEVAARRNWMALIAIPATFCIGVSCGLPLYLFLRSRPVT
jgi:hypothetical protein